MLLAPFLIGPLTTHLAKGVTAMTTVRLHCQKCQGAFRAEVAIDPLSGLVIQQYVCINCGRRWHADQEPRPLTAAWSQV